MDWMTNILVSGTYQCTLIDLSLGVVVLTGQLCWTMSHQPHGCLDLWYMTPNVWRCHRAMVHAAVVELVPVMSATRESYAMNAAKVSMSSRMTRDQSFANVSSAAVTHNSSSNIYISELICMFVCYVCLWLACSSIDNSTRGDIAAKPPNLAQKRKVSRDSYPKNVPLSWAGGPMTPQIFQIHSLCCIRSS